MVISGVLPGMQYDKSGNLDDWWTNQSAASFKDQTECLINQYQQFPVEGSHVSTGVPVQWNVSL